MEKRDLRVRSRQVSFILVYYITQTADPNIASTRHSADRALMIFLVLNIA